MKKEIKVLPLGTLLTPDLLDRLQFTGYTQPSKVFSAVMTFFSSELNAGLLRLPEPRTATDLQIFVRYLVGQLEMYRFDLKSQEQRQDLIATVLQHLACDRDSSTFWKLLTIHCFTRGFDATVPTEQLVIPQQVVPLVALPA